MSVIEDTSQVGEWLTILPESQPEPVAASTVAERVIALDGIDAHRPVFVSHRPLVETENGLERGPRLHRTECTCGWMEEPGDWHDTEEGAIWTWLRSHAAFHGWGTPVDPESPDAIPADA